MNMGTDDWQMNKTLWQCTKHMLENQIDCDVNFRIGDEAANIKAHKMILRLRSPVFDRMFSGAFQESEKDPVIPDVSPAAFYTLLRYCYYDSKKKFDPFTIKPGISMAEIELFKVCNAWAAAECQRQGMDPNGANKRTVLGECLFKIRFPTMIYRDLVNIVYPTGILTQTEKDNLCLYNHQQTDSQCQIDFPAKERPFIVTTGGRSYNSPPKSMVLVRSDVRVELSRIWIQDPGRWTVTVRDEKSGESWSMRRPARYEEHCLTDLRCTQLYFLDIKPYLFEAQSKYFITVEAFGNAYPPERNIDNIQFVKEGEVSPYEEVKITRSTQMENTIYALTLRLV